MLTSWLEKQKFEEVTLMNRRSREGGCSGIPPDLFVSLMKMPMGKTSCQGSKANPDQRCVIQISGAP
jgi:hypothetical protein